MKLLDFAWLYLTLQEYAWLNFKWLCLTLNDLTWHCLTFNFEFVSIRLTLHNISSHWFSMHDYSWLCMTLYDFAWLCMTFLDFAWCCLSVNDLIKWLSESLSDRSGSREAITSNSENRMRPYRHKSTNNELMILKSSPHKKINWFWHNWN